MTPAAFRAFADALPEPMLLLDGAGDILAGNRAAGVQLGLAPEALAGRSLAALVREPPEAVSAYIARCARSRALVPGTLSLGDDGTAIACRAEGAAVEPAGVGQGGAVLLRLWPHPAAGASEARGRASEQQFESFMMNSPAHAFIKDAAGRYLFVNRRIEEAFGRAREEWIGRTDADLFSAEAARDYRANDQQVLASGTSAAFLEVFPQADGPHRYLTFKFPLRGNDGEWLLGGMAVDMTEQLRATEALRRSQERLRLIVDSAQDYAIITYAGDGTMTSWNSGARNIFGYTDAEAIGADGRILFVPEDRAQHVPDAEMAKALSDGRAQNERWHVRKDGSRFWASGLMMPLRDEGVFVGFLKIMRDMTEARLAEQRLRDSEQRFRTLAETIPQLAWTARPDGHVTWFNRRWYEYTGTTVEAMLGEGWQTVPDPAVLPTALARWRSSLATGEPFDMVLPLRGADGRYRPFLTRVVPLTDPEGRIEQWFGTNTDISEQQAVEAVLREEDRRKDEFLATLAHELRNPLAPLRHGLHVMELAHSDPAAIAEARGMMARQLQHLVRLVDDLLDLSRISQGKVTLRRETVALSAVVTHALEACDPLIRQSGHDLTVRLPSHPVSVEGDRIRLSQVLTNLLSNAAKYSERGSRIWLTIEREGEEAVIRVRDTGVGIPAAMLTRVFDVFTQVDHSLEKAHGGLGIGLTIVKRLVELHGGRVEARSEGAGMGSEFILRFPASDADERDATQHERGHSEAPAGQRVLIVDDNVDAADSLAMMLKIMGHEVRCAYDGAAAVDVAETFAPQLILLDIGMPHVNGYEVCRRIRAQPWGTAMVIVALTGWGQDEDRRRSREAGFNHHLVKPVEPDALEDLLGTLPAAQ